MNNKKYLYIYLALVGSILALAFGTSYALEYASDTTINTVSTAKLRVEVIENYNPPEHVYPSLEVEKLVNMKNTGDVDAIIRVKVEKAWGDSRDEAGNLNIVPTLPTDNILVEYNDEYWIEDPDGYFYYKGILKPGETTLEPIFENFIIDPQTGNEYQNMLGDLIVTTEVIQADNNVIEDAWDKTYDYISVYPPDNNIDYGKTKVTFISPNKLFNIHTTKIDLFTNFSELIPGSKRTQLIEVGNDYTEVQPIYLKANVTAQSREVQDLITYMLENYINISITDTKDSKLIYEGPVYGNLNIGEENEDPTNNMKYFILLGNFAPKEYAELKVELSVDKAMGNEYQSLLGNIEWEFLTSFEQRNPYTGDETTNYIIMGVSALLIIAVSTAMLIKMKKDKEKYEL